MWPQFKRRCFCFVLLDRIESDFGEMCYQILMNIFLSFFAVRKRSVISWGFAPSAQGN